jgi:hypothetical protein
MDGGVRQKIKAEEVKTEVRSAAARRRGTIPIDVMEHDAAAIPLDITEHDDTEPCHDAVLITDEYLRSILLERSPFSDEPTSDSSSGTTSTSTTRVVEPVLGNTLQSVLNEQEILSISNTPDGEQGKQELDRRFIMVYFEYCFPFLFPFYKPPLLDGGRSWIMELVVGNQAMWHTTLCLSTYFVSVSLDAASGRDVCKALAWEKLLDQMGVAFRMLQCKLEDVNSSSMRDTMVQKSRIMGSVIQLQRFEIAVGNFENCEKHLHAAIALFIQIFRAAENIPEEMSGLPAFYRVLNQMGRPLWGTASRDTRAWSSDQAAFRFYSALLIVDDVIASTIKDEPPKLLDYHAHIFKSSGNLRPLNLDDFIGCEDWVIRHIGETSALDAWKKSMKKTGQLDMMELVARASSIKQSLLSHLARLDAAANTPKTSRLGLFTLYNEQLPQIPGGCTAFVTRVWAHAALLYLSIVVSGWQPGSAGIRENLVRVLGLLEQMPSPELLRTMVWPFCITGCLAEPEEESRFRVMADALVPYRLFGAARKALEVMENVWKARHELTTETDFATCAGSLGYLPLLV